MKVVIATPLYPPEIGGPATYAKLLEAGLPKHGIEVVLVKFAEVRHLPKVVRHYAYYRRVYKAAQGADLILALDPVSVGWAVRKAARCLNKPYVVKIVGDYAWEQGQQRFGVTENLDQFVKNKKVPFFVRILRHVETQVARSAKKVIVPSDYLKSIVEAWGIAASKIEAIYNAIEREDAGTVPEAVAKLARPLVVTAARLVPWKRVDGVIDAVAATSGVSLVVVGDGPLKGELEARAQEKLASRAIFTGKLSHADTLAVIKSADIFVLNSSYEGLSHLLVEAQMLGTPTIATAVGGNPEVITDGQNGLLVASGDTAALTAAIVRLLADPELGKRFTEASREASKRFAIDTMLESTATFLKALV